MADAAVPVACTLSPQELQERREELLPGLVRLAVAREAFARGVRLRFAPAPNIVSQIARVVDAERACCAFLSFEISVDRAGGPVTLAIVGPPEALPLLKQLTTD